MDLAGRFLRSLAAHYNSVCGWAAYRLGWTTTARRHYERVLVLRGADFGAYVHLGRISFSLGDYAGWRREFEHARRADPRRFAKLRHPFELFEPRLAGTDFDETGERATWRTLRPFGNGPFGNGPFGNGPFGSGPMGNGPLGHGPIGKGGPKRAGLSSDNTSEPKASEPIASDPIASDPMATEPMATDLGLDAFLPAWETRMDAADGTPRSNKGPVPGKPDEQQSADDCASLAERRRFRELGPIVASDIARCDIDDLVRRLSG